MTDYNTSGRDNHARAIIDHAPANVAAVEDELLTITEVADIVRAPVATLRYWRNLGTGPHSFRIGPRRALLAPRRHHLAATAELRQ